MSRPAEATVERASLATPLRRRLAGVGIVAAVVLIQVLSQYVANRDLGRLGSVLLFLALEMPPMLLALSAFYAAARHRSFGVLPMVAGGIALSGALGAFFGLLFWWLSVNLPDMNLHLSSVHPFSATRAVIFGLTNGLGHFGLWTLAFALPVAFEADKLRLEAEKLRVAAELARLRSHLEPHFLLNTLNAIAGLITEDARVARRLLVCLGDLLRDALHEEDELQTLDAQVAWLKRYAEILETRHRGMLAFRWELDAESAQVLVPRLLLQPLVENAVQHGALKREGGGEVVIRTARGEDPSTVVCTVEDNGPGMPAQVRDGAFGLQSVRRRLELRYDPRARFSVESSAQGTKTVVQLPRDLTGAARAT
jgi:signal transduction histidine kinase